VESRTRWAATLLAGAVLAMLPLSSAVAAARSSGGGANPYSPSYGHDYRHGAVPTIGQLAEMRSYAAAHAGAAGSGASADTLKYQGGLDGIGVTSAAPRVYLVFWGKQWGNVGTDASGNLTFSHDVDNGAPYIQNLMKGLGTGNETWSGTMTQYCDGPGVTKGATECSSGEAHVGYPTGGAYAGAWYDDSREPKRATQAQLAAEAVKAAAHFGNSTQADNRYVQYVIMSPHGADPDRYKADGFCAWHDWTGSADGDIAYTNLPYVMDVGASCGGDFVNTSGALDGYSMVEGHEYAETITDQLPSSGWVNPSTEEEAADECAWISSGQGAAADVSTSTGSFAMQSIWSNDTDECEISHVTVN
jgi:serine protease